MGLYKRKDSQFYWMTFRINGKKIFESTGTANKKRAERIHAKCLTEREEGKWFDKASIANVTMTEVMDRYMKEVSPSLAPSTESRNSQIVKNLKAFFGNTLLKDVTSAVVSSYKAKCLEKEYSRETILRELELLRRIFNIAIQEWELCRDNPVPKALKTLGKIDNKRVRYLSPDELRRLTVALPAWLRPIVTIARHTGLRRRNLIELTWAQIDLGRKGIAIPKTKNGSAIGIPLSETAVKTLAEVQRIRHLLSPYVFCELNGKLYTRDKVSMAFSRACKRAQIVDMRFHDLRHDFASSLIQSGIDINMVRELLGHKDLRMTLRYCHLAPENLSEAVKVLDKKENGYFLVTDAKEKRIANSLTS
jgi:integrase